MTMTLSEAHNHIRRLSDDLRILVARDPEQEVTGIAVPVLDSVLSEVRAAITSDPIAQAARDVITPDGAALGEGIEVRAADALVVVGQLQAAIESARSSEGAKILAENERKLFESFEP